MYTIRIYIYIYYIYVCAKGVSVPGSSRALDAQGFTTSTWIPKVRTRTVSQGITQKKAQKTMILAFGGPNGIRILKPKTQPNMKTEMPGNCGSS